MTISTTGLTPTMRRQWEAQQTKARDERARLTDPKKLAQLGVFKWNRTPHYEDEQIAADPLHGRTLMHLSEKIQAEFAHPQEERIGGIARKTRQTKHETGIWMNSPYDVGPRSYGKAGGRKRGLGSPVKA